MANLTDFFTHGLPVESAVSVNCLSLAARRRTKHMVIPTAVAATTTTTGIIAMSKEKIVAASICYFGTVPACSGGTCTIQVDRLATDGTTATVVVTAVDILSGVTANIALALTLAGTNPTSITAGQTVKISVITSNNTVQTSGAGYGVISLQIEPIDPDPIVSA